MQELVSEEVLSGMYVAEKMTAFQRGKPFPHVVFEGFVQKSVVEGLLKAFQKEPFEQKRADLFQFSQTFDLHASKQKAIKAVVKVLDSKEFAEYLTRVTGVKVKAGASDVFGSLYRSTDYLLCHDDQLEGRKLAFILYLTSLREGQGGALALREDVKGVPGKVVKRIHPKAGRLVVFAVSRKSWHQVEEVVSQGNRYALGGWLH
ncbi:2OG-Fe(II) oxygenase [Candidatus Pacearchaeota archaeon]|nr:2OG-Fe(II) oxygenase [Candidatus Pacearchaeota archaeon]